MGYLDDMDREDDQRIRRGDRAFNILMGVIVVLFIGILFVGGMFINLAVAGGDWHCAFSRDAAICAALDRGHNG
jgi:hypothetical protein